LPRNWVHVISGMVALLLVAALIVYSEEAFQAAVAGMKIFWEIVFPSLLPFFVLSEVMLALGVVHFLGVIFEPLMRPLFNVPGAGAFVMSMGLAAGYPMDAVITAKFRKRGLCNQAEAERLLAFTNTADPALTLLRGSAATQEGGSTLHHHIETGALQSRSGPDETHRHGLLFRNTGPVKKPPIRGTVLHDNLEHLALARHATTPSLQCYAGKRQPKATGLPGQSSPQEPGCHPRVGLPQH